MVSATRGVMPVYFSIAASTAARSVSASCWPSLSARRNAATRLGAPAPTEGADVAGEREILHRPLVEVGQRHRARLLLGDLAQRLRQPDRVDLPGRQHPEQRGETARGGDLPNVRQRVAPRRSSAATITSPTSSGVLSPTRAWSAVSEAMVLNFEPGIT